MQALACDRGCMGPCGRGESWALGSQDNVSLPPSLLPHSSVEAPVRRPPTLHLWSVAGVCPGQAGVWREQGQHIPRCAGASGHKGTMARGAPAPWEPRTLASARTAGHCLIGRRSQAACLVKITVQSLSCGDCCFSFPGEASPPGSTKGKQ